MKTTLNDIRNNPKKNSVCEGEWNKLLENLGKIEEEDNEPLSFLTIFESNGLDFTIWVLDSLAVFDRELRLFAIWCAKRVQHLMENPRSRAALDVAQWFAEGQATWEDLEAVNSAAREVAWATQDHKPIQRAAREAAWAVTWGVNETEGAAREAALEARTAAGNSEKQAQIEEFLRLLTCIDSDKRYEI